LSTPVDLGLVGLSTKNGLILNSIYQTFVSLPAVLKQFVVPHRILRTGSAIADTPGLPACPRGRRGAIWRTCVRWDDIDCAQLMARVSRKWPWLHRWPRATRTCGTPLPSPKER